MAGGASPWGIDGPGHEWGGGGRQHPGRSCEESGDSPAALDSDPMVNREQTGAHMPLKRSSLFPLGVAVQACKGIPTQERTIDL